MKLRQELLGIERIYATASAMGVATAGLILMLAPTYRTPTLSVAYDTMSPSWWGFTFLVSAVLFIVFRSKRSAAAPIAFVMTTYSSMLGWAAITVAHASPTAWVWPAIVAVVLTLGVARGDL